MRRALAVLSLLGLAALASGCGLRRVPGDILDKLPYEARIELLEAENDLALAVDRLDEARAEIERTRQQIRRARDREGEARGETRAATDERAREVAELAVVEAQKRVEWLYAQQRLNQREESLADQNLTCAFARYEQARLAAAKKAKLEGSERLQAADFEQQVKDCDARYAEAKARFKETSGEADAVKAEWDKARAALAKKTFDARASPFVE